MRNWVEMGEIITLVAPYDLESGTVFRVGPIIAVATGAAPSGAYVDAAVSGVFDLAKVSAQAWTAGVSIYWDDAAKLCTTLAAGNTPCGIAAAAAADPSPVGRVRLG